MKKTEDEFKNIIKESSSYSEALKKCGYNNLGNSRILKERIVELNLDISHFDKGIKKNKKLKIPNDKIFIENSTVSRSLVKKRLIKDLKWELKCNSCNRTEWCSRTTGNQPHPINLELEHKNGINNDNRLENNLDIIVYIMSFIYFYLEG